jgi:hypothetical protein
MDLTPGRQRLIFALIAVVLVGLCAYLISNRHSGNSTASSASASASPAASASAPAGVPPSVIPSATPASTAEGAEIYQWLPFTGDQLNQAVQTVNDFAAAYATWSYKDSAAAYEAQFKGLADAGELSNLAYTYDTQGVAQARTGGKQVSTGSGTVDRISTFGADPVSITFVVDINEKVTSAGPTSKTDNSYNLTIEMTGGSWLVDSIELQSLGNH